jgi:putative serine protease PepD
MTRFRISITLAAVCIAVAVGAGLASSTTTATEPASSLSAATSLQNAFVNVYKQVSPSVVQIQTSEGLGSGIVFDNQGDIVTNDHVVGSAKTFIVTTTAASKPLTGRLVGTFQEDDLAVIKVDGAGLRPATFADSAKLRVGDIAMAIGNPLGLSSSFTQGIISALNRQEPEGNNVVLANAIQTSAAINPGNSGGALVDLNGEVVGIPTLAAADPQLGGAAAGIGFAIPSNVVKSIATQLVANGKVTSSGRAYLGIRIADTGNENGVYVTSVLSGTAAAKAGLETGERITAVNGTPTPDSNVLGTVLAALRPGQTVTVKVATAAGSASSVKLTLDQYPGA